LSLESNATLETTTILAARTASSPPTLVTITTLVPLESDAVELLLELELAILETTSALLHQSALPSLVIPMLEPA